MSPRSERAVHVAVLSIELDLPESRDLKHKRSILQSLLIALRREFSCSAAEIDWLDAPSASVIACAVLANDGAHGQRHLQKIPPWIERHRHDVVVVDLAVELR